jgi:hypothetical protein
MMHDQSDYIARLENRVRFLENRVHFLEERESRLLATIDALTTKNEFLTRHPRLVAAIQTEKLVASLVGSPRTTGNASFDIDGSVRIEVKYSSLTWVGSVSRWTWGKIYGQGGHKSYDRLLLFGDKDVRYGDEYADPSSPWQKSPIPWISGL